MSRLLCVTLSFSVMSLSLFLQLQPFALMWPAAAAGKLFPHLYLSVPLFKHSSSPQSWALLSFRLSLSHFSFDRQLASLAPASFFDPTLLSQPLNTFNLLSSSLICHSIHPMLPFIIWPYLLLPSVLLLLSACLRDGFKDLLSPSTQ